jgi:Holliday junction resolvase RusA-like endonuclease
LPPYTFSVSIDDFEPMSGSKGKGKRTEKKIELASRIKNQAKEEIQTAADELRGRHVHVKVHFRLWKGDETHTNTTSKKDLDNLLKLVLDVLQLRLDAQHPIDGLGIINNDEDVFYAEATKEVIANKPKTGLDLVIYEFEGVSCIKG